MSLALLIAEAHGRLTLSKIPKYNVGKGEVLIKNVSGALNPIEWKQISYGMFIPSYPFVLGADTAGIVEEVGEGVSNLKKGDRVFGLPPRGESRFGTYQEYTVAQADLLGKIPEHVTYSQAATLGLCSITAAVGLYKSLQIPTPFSGLPHLPSNSVLIWGGSSSVGSYAVQLAKLTGFKTIVSTASPQNFDYVKSLGATHVFDYKSPDVIEKIKEVTSDDLKLVFDAMGTHDTSMKALGKEGGVVASTRAQGETTTDKITVRGVFAGVIFTNERQFGSDFYRFLEKQLSLGSYIPNEIQRISNGLAGVESGLSLLKEGKVSAKKLVFEHSETPKLE